MGVLNLPPRTLEVPRRCGVATECATSEHVVNVKERTAEVEQLNMYFFIVQDNFLKPALTIEV